MSLTGWITRKSSLHDGVCLIDNETNTPPETFQAPPDGAFPFPDERGENFFLSL